MKKEQFIVLVNNTIDMAIQEIYMQKQQSDKKNLTYIDSKILSRHIKNIFVKSLHTVPKQIEASCLLSETILAPSIVQKIENLKNVIGILGGIAGITSILSGVGMALGWGSGVLYAVETFFVGSSLAGPLGWISGGFGLVAIATYFTLSDNDAQRDEKYITTLTNSITKSIDDIWEKYKHDLSNIDKKS